MNLKLFVMKINYVFSLNYNDPQLSLFYCSDTICDMGGAEELANYGEYSGAPSESQTFEYAKTILGLMTKENHPDGIIIK